MIDAPELLNDADTNGIHDLLFEQKDYVRRIHWWVRFFGVLWFVSVGLGIIGFIAFTAGVGRSVDTKFDGVNSSLNSGSSPYMQCLEDPATTAAQCDLLPH